MPLPKVVREWKREMLEKEPPSTLRLHPWLSERSKNYFSRHYLDHRRVFPLYLSSTAELRIRRHAHELAAHGLEALGLLIGDRFRHNDKEYCQVEDVVSASLETSRVSVRFHRASFGELFEKLDEHGTDYLILGWYHSHPGHTVFLSERDIETQVSSFKDRHHTAIVIDTLNKQFEAFVVRNGKPKLRGFVVYKSTQSSRC